MALGRNTGLNQNAHGRLRAVRFAWPVLLALAILSGPWLPVQPIEAQGVGPSLQIGAPQRVKLGAPFQVTLSIRDVADIAGYEINLGFDTSAADFGGVSQRRQGDLKALGRDIQNLGPIEHAGIISFGLFSCPLANCVDRNSARHDQGGRGQLRLATVELAAHKEGILELHFSGATFVDATGNTVSVSGADQTVRVQVGTAQTPVFAAPVAPPALVQHAPHAASARPGPFDLSHRGVVDYAAAAQVAVAWMHAREQGTICGADIDPAADINHDGCLDVSDVQRVAANFGQPGIQVVPPIVPKPTAARTPTPPAGLAPAANKTPSALTTTGARTPGPSGTATPVAEGTADDQVAAAIGDVASIAAAGTPATFTVTSTGDQDDQSFGGTASCAVSSTTCTFRAAIELSNGQGVSGNSSVISFNIPGRWRPDDPADLELASSYGWQRHH